MLGEAARPIRNVVHEGLLRGGGFNWYHPGARMRGAVRGGGWEDDADDDAIVSGLCMLRLCANERTDYKMQYEKYQMRFSRRVSIGFFFKKKTRPWETKYTLHLGTSQLRCLSKQQ